MANTPRLPPLPTVNDPRFLDAVKQTLEQLKLSTGSALSTAERAKAAVDAVVKGMDGGVSGVSGAIGNAIGLPVLQAPPAPTGFTAHGVFSVILLSWTRPRFANYAYTEVKRASTNDLGAATTIGQSPSTMYSDQTGGGAKFYYWIRYVSTSGVSGPWSQGLYAETPEDPAWILEKLAGKIKETELYKDLNERIDLIDGSELLAGSVAYRIKEEADARIQAITNEADLRVQAIADEAKARGIAISDAISQLEHYADEDSATAIALTHLIATFGGNIATALDYTIAEVDSKSATATTLNELVASFGGNASEALNYTTLHVDAESATAIKLSSLVTSFGGNEATAMEYASNYVDDHSATASKVNTLEATVNDPDTGITSKASSTQLTEAVADEKRARVKAINNITATITDADTGLPSRASVSQMEKAVADEGDARAKDIGQVNTNIGKNKTAVEKVSSSVDGIKGQYTVKIDNNGFMSGFGLASEPVDGVPFSEFLILADRTAIIAPGATTVDLTSITRSGSTATATSATAHKLTTDDYVVITGAEQGEYNGAHKVASIPTSKTFTFSVSGEPDSPATIAKNATKLVFKKSIIPFIVDAQGKVHLGATTIVDATITAEQVESSFIEKLTAEQGEITAASIDQGSVWNLVVGNTIQSGYVNKDNPKKYVFNSTYKKGKSGWEVRADGSAEFNNLNVRGLIYNGTLSSNGSVSGLDNYIDFRSNSGTKGDFVLGDVSKGNYISFKKESAYGKRILRVRGDIALRNYIPGSVPLIESKGSASYNAIKAALIYANRDYFSTWYYDSRFGWYWTENPEPSHVVRSGLVQHIDSVIKYNFDRHNLRGYTRQLLDIGTYFNILKQIVVTREGELTATISAYGNDAIIISSEAYYMTGGYDYKTKYHVGWRNCDLYESLNVIALFKPNKSFLIIPETAIWQRSPTNDYNNNTSDLGNLYTRSANISVEPGDVICVLTTALVIRPSSDVKKDEKVVFQDTSIGGMSTVVTSLKLSVGFYPQETVIM